MRRSAGSLRRALPAKRPKGKLFGEIQKLGLILAAPAPDNLNAFLAFVFHAEELFFFFLKKKTHLGSDEDKNVTK